MVTTLVELTVDMKVVPPSFLDSREHMRPMVDRIWTFLAEEYMHLHLRASQLIWMLQDMTAVSHEVETAIASYLVSDNTKVRIDAFQKFGVFWRLSGKTEFFQPAKAATDSFEIY